MSLDDAVVEVIEYADGRGVLVRVRVTDEPGRLLNGLDLAEDLIDSPAQLGAWADGPDGIWRGLAVLASAL